MAINSRKVAMVGCGFVGSASAFALMQSSCFWDGADRCGSEPGRGRGSGYQSWDGFRKSMKIYAGTYDDVSDAAIIVITAGANQKPEETRLDLIQKNAKIMRSIIGEIKSGILRHFADRFQPGGISWPILRWRNRAIPRTASSAPEPFWILEDFGMSLATSTNCGQQKRACTISSALTCRDEMKTAAWSDAPRVGGLKISNFASYWTFCSQNSWQGITDHGNFLAYEIISKTCNLHTALRWQ